MTCYALQHEHTFVSCLRSKALSHVSWYGYTWRLLRVSAPHTQTDKLLKVSALLAVTLYMIFTRKHHTTITTPTLGATHTCKHCARPVSISFTERHAIDGRVYPEQMIVTHIAPALSAGFSATHKASI